MTLWNAETGGHHTPPTDALVTGVNSPETFTSEAVSKNHARSDAAPPKTSLPCQPRPWTCLAEAWPPPIAPYRESVVEPSSATARSATPADYRRTQRPTSPRESSAPSD